MIVGVELLERAGVRLPRFQARAEVQEDLRPQAQDRAAELPISGPARAVQGDRQVEQGGALVEDRLRALLAHDGEELARPAMLGQHEAVQEHEPQERRGRPDQDARPPEGTVPIRTGSGQSHGLPGSGEPGEPAMRPYLRILLNRVVRLIPII